MRVLRGRRRAAALTLSSIFLVSSLAAAPVSAADPPGLERFMRAVARVESGGNHRAVNPVSGAYGRYQILPENWRAWARRYLGNANAKPTAANQEKVARAKMISLYRWLGSWKRVAHWWLTGSARTTSWSTAAKRYVSRVMTLFGGPDPGADARASNGGGDAATTRYSERSSTVDYTGTWRSARHGGYVGGAVRYATSDGASASITFTGRRIAWYGPVGPTRGKARILIDGEAVRTVNLQRSGFEASTILYSVSWKTPGRHTFTVEVIETKGHRLVAIDEFVVTK